MADRPPSRLRAAGIAAVVALALLVAGGQIGPGRWYAASGAYRAQVDALLAGRLGLSRAPEAMQHDLAWTDDGVQQVWGLGVAMWQAPFELAARAVGCAPFPDRLALLGFVALALAVTLRAWRRPDEPWWIGWGSALIVGLLPGFVTLLRGRVGPYEEAAIYAYAAAILLLGGTARLGDAPGRARLLVLAGAAGLTGFIRPTVWFYGLATLIVGSAMYLRARGRRGALDVALACVLFVAGGAALYATNARRFGDGMEFGHRLNLESLPGNLYATRFSYPFERAPLATALGEELGSLFDRPDRHHHTTFYGRHLHVGQAPIARWREYYFTTFSWGYLPVIVAGLVLGALAWRRRDGPDAIARWLVAWAVIGGGPLFVFYLHAPSVSSRYQLDLAPAFAALIVIAWRALARRLRAGWACALLGAAWLASVVTSNVAPRIGPDAVDRAAADAATAAIEFAEPHPHALGTSYDLDDPWLAVETDVADQLDACVDEAGARTDPDATPLGGERCLHGVRAADGEHWLLWASQVTPDDVPAERCELARGVCEPAPTAATAGEPVALPLPEPCLYLNLFRWDLATGQVPSATFAWVEDPAFVELDLRTLDGQPADWAHDVQVAIGRTHLRLVSLASLPGDGVRLRFAAPALPRGLQVAFFAFGPDRELDSVRTRFAVRRIRWR